MNEFRLAQDGMRPPGVTGWWERIPETLTPDQQQALLRAAADPTISHRAIMLVLRQWELNVTASQVGHWRRNHYAV